MIGIMNDEIKEIIAGIRRALSLLGKAEKHALITATSIMVITGALTNLPAVILGRLVDSLNVQTTIDFDSILPYILLIIVIILSREGLAVLRKYKVENVATHVEKQQTVATLSHIIKADNTSLGALRIGTLHGRMLRSIDGLVKMIKLGFLELLPSVFTAVTAIIIVLTQKPLVAGVMLLVIPAGLYIIVKQIGSQKGIRVSLLRGKEQIDGSVVEMLGGLETVRSLDTTGFEVNRIEVSAENLRRIEIKHHIQMALYDAAKYLNEGFFYVLVICLSIYLASRGIITKGDILVYSILFTSVLNPLRDIHRILDEAHESSIRINDLYTLQAYSLDESYLTGASTNDGDLNNRVAVDFINVSYQYAARPEHKVLDNINLFIEKGEKIGIAGVSGGGKSTLVKILLRLQHGYSGKVRLNGTDLKTINRTDLASRLAYIPQKTYIFSGTIRDNIIYGSGHSEVSDEQVIEVAKKAHIWDEIKHSLGGLDGVVAEQGNNLSGGQKQRIALARILLHAPDIIIFDEATSSLDNRNEADVQKMLEEVFHDKTVIAIAHRLTTLRNCDRILVLSDGQISQEGSYAKLSKEPGLFNSLLHQK